MLQTLANLSQILGVLTVIAAIVFGLAQTRQFHQKRRDVIAVELMRSIQDAEFTRSLRLLLALPTSITGEEFRALGETYEIAAYTLSSKYEALGYLVFRGIMPIELVEELIGGVGVQIWVRLKPWVLTLREELGQPLLGEWYQWFAEQMQMRERPQAVPTYIRYRDWHPPS